MKLLAVTACPTGIAHTYMAAEALEVAAEEAGHEIVVETQGSAGSTPFTPEQLAEAEAIILAADVEVRDKERFAHLPTIAVGVKKAIGGADGLIEAAVAEATARPKAAAGTVPAQRSESRDMSVKSSGPGFGSKLRGWLMTGVSYVIPFVAAGGLLIALGFALGGYQITEAPDIVSVGDDGVVSSAFNAASLMSWAALSFQIGSLAFSLLVPVLAGFIAYAIADRPALVPGFVGGLIAVQTQAGFLGGLVAGLLAGALIYWLKTFRVPRALAGIMPVLVLPLIGTAVVGAVMFVVVGQPLAAATTGLTSWLNGLSGTNAVLLGALLGLMMAFDMGGPVNKAAYAFAVAGLSTESDTALLIMAAVMAAGMTPPLAMALATTVRKRLFTEVEQENGRAAWLLGASFITEGAIPFAAADPLRVIPSLMVGSAVTGSLSMAFGSTLRAPHGGIFVVPLIGNPFAYLFAIVAGTLVSAALVIALKSVGRRTTAEADVPATATAPATAAVA
ncbi:PTS system D-fructose-specific IIB component (F1P-forming) (Frc family) /PTS system D-fructose-specific IIC component (F1P-forming) (Frc family) [Pseudonocardia sediminis]|uniref:PTS system D-fructose-specific IIB component (F1P-forming) (Frc family) /PTS system D-fructose-specific IIC component (F1P-forming) (Frc family) n=1 Tax=Pseudonocardia sediminis TaxID=1397368 RepID=A0A4Q7V471_PSEST|nr:fructose-specific PTS transporter subunit EIIC [Pseudonocardia sediminis]RZT88885.1 PTS system D-fructose-specific IIB component (F1P-forming) (Frc family) /PTS system D-fructose-specific IIC component (F1P-forming) (Frc family) [Pseudonocardia sediminis]